jgi:hypothetical protein
LRTAEGPESMVDMRKLLTNEYVLAVASFLLIYAIYGLIRTAEFVFQK